MSEFQKFIFLQNLVLVPNAERPIPLNTMMRWSAAPRQTLFNHGVFDNTLMPATAPAKVCRGSFCLQEELPEKEPHNFVQQTRQHQNKKLLDSKTCITITTKNTVQKKINPIMRMAKPTRAHYEQPSPRQQTQPPTSDHLLSTFATFQAARAHPRPPDSTICNNTAVLSHPRAGRHLHTLPTPTKGCHKTFKARDKAEPTREHRARSIRKERDAREGRGEKNDARSTEARQKTRACRTEHDPLVPNKTRKKSLPEVLPGGSAR